MPVWVDLHHMVIQLQDAASEDHKCISDDDTCQTWNVFNLITNDKHKTTE